MSATTRTLSIVCALAVVLATVPLGGVSAPAPEYDVTVELPQEFHTGENEIRVVVDNSDSDEVLFSPIIEVPLGSALSVPDEFDPDPRVEYGVTSAERTYQVLDASYRVGESLYVYGEEVSPGEVRTYAFSVVVERSGSVSVEADVRPMYNEQMNVRSSTDGVALGTGTLNVVVEDEFGSPVTDATVIVDETTRTGGDLSITTAEGDREVAAIANGRTLPTLSVSITEGAAENAAFVAPASLEEPAVLATTGDGTVVDGTVSRTETQAGNADRPTTFELSYLVETDGGTTVVGVGPPPEIPPAFEGVTGTVDDASQTVETTDDGTMLITLDGAGTFDVTLTFDGYRTGDATGSGTVDRSDARHVAKAVATGDDVNPYADVDGDGELTAVDAMLIAQYAEDNRDADFRIRGGN